MINRDTFELGQDPERHASTRQRWHKRNLALATFTVLGLLLVVCSCGQSGLSRSKAKTLLEDVKDIQTLASCPALQNNALEKGWIIGVFEKKAPGRYDFLSGPTYTLTKKGQEVFTKTDWWTPPQPEATLTYNPKRYLVANPKKAAGLNFKITGITVPPKSSEGEKIKEVQFSWQYTDLPFVVKRLIVSGGNGKAPFRLYDDGWRVEKDKIELKYSHTPAQLTAQVLDDN